MIYSLFFLWMVSILNVSHTFKHRKWFNVCVGKQFSIFSNRITTNAINQNKRHINSFLRKQSFLFVHLLFPHEFASLRIANIVSISPVRRRIYRFLTKCTLHMYFVQVQKPRGMNDDEDSCSLKPVQCAMEMSFSVCCFVFIFFFYFSIFIPSGAHLASTWHQIRQENYNHLSFISSTYTMHRKIHFNLKKKRVCDFNFNDVNSLEFAPRNIELSS